MANSYNRALSQKLNVRIIRRPPAAKVEHVEKTVEQIPRSRVVKLVTKDKTVVTKEIEPEYPAELWGYWGPYLAERQWGTVRESKDLENSWTNFTYEDARSKAYTKGEDGIFGLSDFQCTLCHSYAFWNKRDDHLKERLFGVTNVESQLGEDVKEAYVYKSADPHFKYLNATYVYPQNAFPYNKIRETEQRSSLNSKNSSLLDVADLKSSSQYFDISYELAKKSPSEVFFKLTITNHHHEEASLVVLPMLWLRKTDEPSDNIIQLFESENVLKILTNKAGSQNKEEYYYYFESTSEHPPQAIFTDNQDGSKAAFNKFIVGSDPSDLRFDGKGTKCGMAYGFTVPGKGQVTVRSFLTPAPDQTVDWEAADKLFTERKEATETLLESVLPPELTPNEKFISKRALSNLLFNRLYYNYSAKDSQSGGKFSDFKFEGLITAPDKWENPYLAVWDSAFHAISLCRIDFHFAKKELANVLALMHHDGALPSDEYGLERITPPVLPIAVLELFKKFDQDVIKYGFLNDMYSKLLKNFSWWINQTDSRSVPVKNGGIVGVDYVCLFQRESNRDCNDAVVWSGMFAAQMLEIALQLSVCPKGALIANPLQHFEEFQHLANTLHTRVAQVDNFFFPSYAFETAYDLPLLNIYHSFGYVPLFGNFVIPNCVLQSNTILLEKFSSIAKNSSSSSSGLFVKHLDNVDGGQWLVSWISQDQLVGLCRHLFDENKFLSQHGIRTMSKEHDGQECTLHDGHTTTFFQFRSFDIQENYGGNSNWLGAVNLPYNYLILRSLQNWERVYAGELTIEYPTNSGKKLTLSEIIKDLASRISNIFVKQLPANFDVKTGLKPDQELLFYEFYDGDSGEGGGASHKGGWCSLIIKIFEYVHLKTAAELEEEAKKNSSIIYIGGVPSETLHPIQQKKQQVVAVSTTPNHSEEAPITIDPNDPDCCCQDPNTAVPIQTPIIPIQTAVIPSAPPADLLKQDEDDNSGVEFNEDNEGAVVMSGKHPGHVVIMADFNGEQPKIDKEKSEKSAATEQQTIADSEVNKVNAEEEHDVLKDEPAGEEEQPAGAEEQFIDADDQPAAEEMQSANAKASDYRQQQPPPANPVKQLDTTTVSDMNTSEEAPINNDTKGQNVSNPSKNPSPNSTDWAPLVLKVSIVSGTESSHDD